MQVREDIKPIPDSMRSRPVDHRGFPVPWFVTRRDPEGHWDFVNIESSQYVKAIQENFCWVSGQPLGRFKAFVVGPMCVVNRVAGDPPVKRDIALWSVRVCPFLSRPLAKRSDIPEELKEAQRGIMIERNPGVCAVYITKDYKFDRRTGILKMGEPENVTWWARGRIATREEVMEGMDSGLPILRKLAKEDGIEAEKLLDKQYQVALEYLPL
jgi:hypothetical protein